MALVTLRKSLLVKSKVIRTIMTFQVADLCILDA